MAVSGSEHGKAALMARRRWLWLGLAVLLIAAAGVGFLAFRLDAEPKSDCQVVRELIAYNKSQTDKFNENLLNPEYQSTVAEYQPWADRLREFASQINDPALKERVDRFAEGADRMVDLVRQGESGQLTPQDPLAPLPTEPYREVAEPMYAELQALDTACPAG